MLGRLCRWKAASTEVKDKYQQLAAEDKARFDREQQECLDRGVDLTSQAADRKDGSLFEVQQLPDCLAHDS